MSEHKFPASLPRRMYWAEEISNTALCPECGGKLEAEHHAYLMATQQKGESVLDMTGTPNGCFCGECPVVVLQRKEFGEFAAMSVQNRDGLQYAVMGMVDFDAIPEEKMHLPLGDDNEPPLVPFLEPRKKKSFMSKLGLKRPHSRKRDNKKRNKRKRKR